MSKALTIHIDGAARGNPGPAAFAYVIQEGATVEEASGYLGRTTNNQAEYTALVRALERAAQLGARRLHIHSDSELLVKQMNGEYQVKNPDLRVLFDQAKQLCEQFDVVTLTHVPREQNGRADRLCNIALDQASGSGRAAKASATPPSDARVRDEALRCLQAAADAWARAGQASQPPPEMVWEQLWSILQEAGVLRQSPR